MSNNDKKLIFILSDYDSEGVPSKINFDPSGSTGNTDLFLNISNEFMNDINSKLPESKRLPNIHPEWIKDSDFHIVEDNVTFDITFVDEGAGYKNTIAYYIYNTDKPPRTLNDVKVLYIIFPNCSKAGAGGNLRKGDSIRLASEYDTQLVKGSWVGTPTNYYFNSGTSVGFCLLANAWKSYKSGVNREGPKYYSRSLLNPESDPKRRFHTVNIKSDYSSNHIIVGFEDLPRDGNADEDFNDAILLARVTPVTALNPCTVNTTGTCHFKGTILGEDTILDASYVNNDFSDAILEYKGTMHSNGDNITSIEMVFHYKHRSTLFDHSFIINIPNISNYRATVTRETFLGSSNDSVVETIPYSSHNVVLFESGKALLPASGNHPHFANTHPGWNQVGVKTPVSSIKLKIVFNEPVTIQKLGRIPPPFKPFLRVYRSGKTGEGNYYDVHYNNTYHSCNKVTTSEFAIPKING